MAEVNTSSTVPSYSLDDLWQMKCIQLKEILKNGKIVTGNKAALIARCYALFSTETDRLSGVVWASDVEKEATTVIYDKDPFKSIDFTKDVTYCQLYTAAIGRQWSTDLRQFPVCNFNQVCDYLVHKTNQYSEKDMKGLTFKKLKSFNYFQEGHISHYEIAKGFGFVWVKAQVMASMRKEKYKAMVIFKENGDVIYCTCECPAGIGIDGMGKCNHVGGLLFAVQDFNAKGLHSQPERIACTSKLNNWIVPRNLQIKPQPLKEINIKKIKFGATNDKSIKMCAFDPRAPQDKQLDNFAVSQLFNALKECAPNSGFFMYHDEPTAPEDDTCTIINRDENIAANVEIESAIVISSQFTKENSSVIPNPIIDSIIPNPNIKDTEYLNSEFLTKYIAPIVENRPSITQEAIYEIELSTRGQADSNLWHKLHKQKVTASNFGKIIKCIKPDGVIKSMLYTSPHSPYLEYGKNNEKNAINAYISHMKVRGSDVMVESVGLILSSDRPEFGASLDGRVKVGSETGGLECKCPLSKAGHSIEMACEDPLFFLSNGNGSFLLKRSHNYYIQVQGQMYVTSLPWVDFVVWFGIDKALFVERIYFNAEFWYTNCLPKLDRFYKWVFVPELITERVKRGCILMEPKEWKKLKNDN